MRNVAVYTGLRLLLFGAALGALYLLGARGLLLLALAVLVSGPASYLLLSRQRDALSGSVVSGAGRLRSRVKDVGRRLDEGAAAEDPGEAPARGSDGTP